MTDIKYDQHFLEDDEIIKLTIKESQITKNDIIFEIGPGKGILTKAILEQNPKQLISVELDEMLKNELQLIGNFPNFKLIFANALEEISNHNFTKLIANIPYAITEPLYKQILQRKIPFCVILHGKTFYDTTQNRKSRWNIYLNAFYDTTLIKEISGESFSPKTKTTSALIKLELKKSVNKKELFIQNLFFKRLSKTQNAICEALSKTLNFTKKESKLKFEELNIDIKTQNQILDTLTNEQFHQLVSKIENKIF